MVGRVSSIFNNMRESQNRKTLPIGMGLINKVLSERNPGQKRMVRFNIPQRLSSKLKPRILNASEIIIMQARVSLLPASASLSRQDTVCLCVNIHSAGRMPLNF